MAEKEKPDYEKMDVGLLNAALLAMSAKLDAARAEVIAVRQIRDRKAGEASIQAKLATMSSDERAALEQYVKAHSGGSGVQGGKA